MASASERPSVRAHGTVRRRQNTRGNTPPLGREHVNIDLRRLEESIIGLIRLERMPLACVSALKVLYTKASLSDYLRSRAHKT